MFHYYKNIFRKLTFRKALNFAKLFFGYYYTRITGKTRQFGMPLFVSIEPTTSCNLRCPQCPSGLRQFSRETGMLGEELCRKVVAELKDDLHSMTFYFQGEPYLNRDLLKMVNHASSENIYTITSTNAHYLDTAMAKATVESGLDKLIISVDGVSEETYRKYRVGGDLTKVFKGTREIVAQKKILRSKTPHVIWQFVVFSHNEHEVDRVKKLGKELGVDEVKIKTAQIYDFSEGHEMIPGKSEFSRYEQSGDGKFRIRNKLLNHCWRMWQGCVVTWDGKVVPCCFDKDAAHRLGNLEQQSFSEVWRSEAYNNFRKSVMTGRKSVDICTNCTEGTKVWAG